MSKEVDVQTIHIETLKEISKPLLAELIGTAFLVLIGCGSTTGGEYFSRVAVNLDISFSFGLTMALILHNIRHISGGHINPAITIGVFAAGHITVLRTVLYIVCQLIGAIIGAAILFGVLPNELRTNLGQTMVHPHVKVGQGLVLEILITFVLVFTVLSVYYPERSHLNGSAPMYIGVSVIVCHLLAVKYTGSSMNPARSFGPAVVGNNWDDHWIYWLGPLIGGASAGLIYRYLLEIPPEKTEIENDA